MRRNILNSIFQIKIIVFSLVYLILLCGCVNKRDDSKYQVNKGSETKDINQEEIPKIVIVDNDKPDYIVKSTDSTDEIFEEQPNADSGESELLEDEMIYLDAGWEYAEYTAIHNDPAILYRAGTKRKNIIVAVDAGHGTSGASGQKIFCHPDKSKKTTGGSTAAGEIKANAQTSGMTFNNGTSEGIITLKVSQRFKDRLLEEGYDVLMLRDTEKIELDLLARTLIANHVADCHISLHYDGDGLNYDKGAFYISVPDGIKRMSPVDDMWELDDELGRHLISGLEKSGVKIYNKGFMGIDLLQTSYSTIPSVDIELGNQCSDTSEASIEEIVDGLMLGVQEQYEQ